MADNEYKVFSFVSGKGGVGKTLIAINTAYELSAHSNVLLIDFDFFNYGLTLWFKDSIENLVRQKTSRNVFTLYDIMEEFDRSREDTVIMQEKYLRDRCTEFCKIKPPGDDHKKIFLLPCFVPFSKEQVTIVLPIF